MMIHLGYLVVSLVSVIALVEWIRILRSGDSDVLFMQKVMSVAILLPVTLAVLVFVFVLGPGVSAAQGEEDAARAAQRIQHAEMVFNKAKEASDKLRNHSAASPLEDITTARQKQEGQQRPAMSWWGGRAIPE